MMRSGEQMMDQNIPEVPIAFFDLDDTLVSKDTNSLWVRWRLEKRLGGFLEAIIGLANMKYYKRGKLTAGKMNAFYRARTLGMKHDRYKKLSEDFFNETGRHYIYEDAVKLILAHKKRGIHTVVITGQDNYVTQEFFDYLKMDGLISNKRIVKNKRFKGMERPNCYGEGKIVLAGKYAEDMGFDLHNSAFYSDSISDLPLLKEVKYPIAVNPDLRLRKIAEDSMWPIYNFVEVIKV